MKTTIEGLGCMAMRLFDIQEELRRVIDNHVYKGKASRVTVTLSDPTTPSTLTATLRIGDETWALECLRADCPDSYTWKALFDKRGCFMGETQRNAERCWKIFDEAEASYDRQADAEEAAIAAARDEWEPA